MGGILYNTYANPSDATVLGPWLAARIQLTVGGGKDMLNYIGWNTNTVWATYVDSCCITPGKAYREIYGVAAAQGFLDPEGAFLHYKVNYRSADLVDTYDQFDFSEMQGVNVPSPTATSNGVFTYADTPTPTYTDVTVRAYCPTPLVVPGTDTLNYAACVNYPANPIAVTQYLYFGLQFPFDTANVTINSSTATGVTYQYWNGTAWTNFTPATDTTNGMTTSGQIISPPPSDASWKRYALNGSQPKYWWRISVGGGTATVGRLWGVKPWTANVAVPPVTISGTACPRCTSGIWWGWDPANCQGGHINQGDADLEYCDTPATASSAHFRAQSRVRNGYYFGVFKNPTACYAADGITRQACTTADSRNIIAYSFQYAADHNQDFPAQNGIMFDNGGQGPGNVGTLVVAGASGATTGGFTTANSDFDSTTYSSWASGAGAAFTAVHRLFIAEYAPKGRFWDGSNTGRSEVNRTMNFAMGEANRNTAQQSQTQGQSMDMCTDLTWCPNLTSSVVSNQNSNHAIAYDQVQTNWFYAINDGSGNWHYWDQSERDPMAALTMYWLWRTNLYGFIYNTQGATYTSVGDDYSYWVPSAATVQSITQGGNPISGSTVCLTTTPCIINLSQPLEVTDRPTSQWYAIRIGGKDVVALNNYIGKSLSTATATHTTLLSSAWSANTPIEYVAVGYQAIDHPLHQPLYRYMSWFPAMGIDLGTPDSTNGFNYPCNGANGQAGGIGPHGAGCLALYGTTASGNPNSCNPSGLLPPAAGNTDGFCAPLFRRDFSSTEYGKTIVLLRPFNRQGIGTYITATSELETPGPTTGSPAGYPLGGTYYRLYANGKTGPATTTAQLRGGEGAIFISTQILAGASITGSITGPGAVAGIRIALTGPSNLNTQTDSSGNFSFTDLPDGNFTVTPASNDYTFTPASAPVTVTNPANPPPVTFLSAARPKFAISGQALNSAGQPIDSVTVSMAAGPGGVTPPFLPVATTTDSSGNFTYNLPNGSYTLTPSKTTTPPTTFSPVNVTVNGQPVTGIVITGFGPINPTAISGNTPRITGDISGCYNMAVDWVRVGATTSVPNQDVGAALTSVQGGGTAGVWGYSFNVSIAGNYTLTPRNPYAGTNRGYLPQSRTVTMTGTPLMGVDFACSTAYTVSGNVADAPAGVELDMTNVSTNNSSPINGPPAGYVIKATTDASGNYTFQNITVGTQQITPISSSFTFNPTTNNNVQVTTGNVNGINFTATSTGPQPAGASVGSIGPSASGAVAPLHAPKPKKKKEKKP
jgi:hypothetical protein